MFGIGKPFVALARSCSLLSSSVNNQVKSFHLSGAVRGFEAFFDAGDSAAGVSTGRAWTVPDLRRKSFEDLHKLWFVLYKERNLLLSSKQKLRRTQRPTTSADEFRYSKVKRSMAGIKHVLNERKKVDKILGISSAIPADYNQQSGAKSTTASK